MGASGGSAPALSARRSMAAATSSASPVFRRSARIAGVRTSGARTSSRRGSNARSLAPPSSAGRPSKAASIACVTRAASFLPRRSNTAARMLEEARGEAARGERAPRVGPGAVEQDVHGGRLVMADVELGERAQHAHVLRELAARGLERLLGAAVVVRRLLVDGGELDDAPALVLRRRRLADELLLELDGARRIVLALVDVDEPLRSSPGRRARDAGPPSARPRRGRGSRGGASRGRRAASRRRAAPRASARGARGGPAPARPRPSRSARCTGRRTPTARWRRPASRPARPRRLRARPRCRRPRAGCARGALPSPCARRGRRSPRCGARAGPPAPAASCGARRCARGGRTRLRGRRRSPPPPRRR